MHNKENIPKQVKEYVEYSLQVQDLVVDPPQVLRESASI